MRFLEGFKMLVLAALAASLFAVCKNDAGIVTDVDGNIYRTVTIGTQTWMAENLKVTHYRNGDKILYLPDEAAWGSTTAGAFCNYNNDSSHVSEYGRLYNWYAVNDSRGIAPEGWHIPGPAEIETLITYLKGDTIAAAKLKSAGLDSWLSNLGADNETGFSALPGGYRHKDGSYHTLGSNGYWWTKTRSYEMFSWSKRVYQGFADVDRITDFMNYGFALRCIKD